MNSSVIHGLFTTQIARIHKPKAMLGEAHRLTMQVWDKVAALLERQLSPDQVSQVLKQDNHSMAVISHENIYRWIYAQEALGLGRNFATHITVVKLGGGV